MDGGAWWAAVHGVATERLPFHFSLSRIGERNGNPLQCSFLENPRDSGAWWAAVYGVTQSRTRLKRLSSSSSSKILFKIHWTWQNVDEDESKGHFVWEMKFDNILLRKNQEWSMIQKESDTDMKHTNFWIESFHQKFWL